MILVAIGTVAIVWTLAEKLREVKNIGNDFIVLIGTISFMWILFAILILNWWNRKMTNANEPASVICEETLSPTQCKLFKELSPMLVELVKAKLAFADRTRINE